MQRRRFLQGCVLVACPLGCARAAVTTAEELTHWGEAFRAAATRNLEDTVRLVERLQRLDQEPSPAHLRLAREGWLDAALGWKGFSMWPVVLERQAYRVQGAVYFPARAQALRGLLDGDLPIRVDVLGADRKGIFGLEALLFDAADGPALVRGDGPRGARARSLALDVGRALEALARRFSHELAAFEFAQLGHKGLVLVMNRLVEDLESLVEARLGLLLAMHAVGRLQPTDVEGQLSKSSHRLLQAEFAAVEQLYPRALVRGRSAEVASRTEAHFDEARTLLGRFDAPLPDWLTRDPGALERAVTTLKALERRIKTEVVQALGVTLTYQSFDGD